MPNCESCAGSGKKLHRNVPLSEQPGLNQYGIYDLLTSDVNAAYTGRYRATNVYVVGFRTEYEKLFKVTDNKAAVAYAKTADPEGILRTFRAPATQIGSDVGYALFGV